MHHDASQPDIPNGKRYAVTALAVLIATALRWCFDPLIGGNMPFLTFYFSVLFAAWYGGHRAGLFALLLGVVGGLLFVTPTFDPAALDVLDRLDLLRYLMLGVGMSLFGGWMHAARRTANKRSAEVLQLLGTMSQENVARRNAELDARDERDRAIAAIDALPDGVIVTDADGRITLMNVEAMRMSGWRSGEANGLPLHAIWRIAETVEHAPNAMRGTLIGRDGSERGVDAGTSPLRDGRGRIIGGIIILRRED